MARIRVSVGSSDSLVLADQDRERYYDSCLRFSVRGYREMVICAKRVRHTKRRPPALFPR